MRKLIKLYMIFIAIVIAGCSQSEQPDNQEKRTELTISAAASMKDALTEIKTAYEKEHSGVELYFNFGGTGMLQQQISQGAPVDLFLSAAEDKFALLVEQGFIEERYSTDLVGNELVLVQSKNRKENLTGFADLADDAVERISIGTPESVPAGKYARELLEYAELWEPVQTKLIFAKDVRQVLTYVETGNVDAGIVYKTDALVSDKVEIAAVAGAETHSPIVYQLGVIRGSDNRDGAIKFYEFLQAKKAVDILEKYGFNSLADK
ncbi:molybdate ABC transporter substrate-binding protein [Bacillus canaveralius]|uniref:Molybdate ABC transporter substrate-binding protein n=1 Tax=Bacillus canaveralius TaxID=1403243 RepID=A0A2N5GSV9_9BACI|nr:molybdate ABC transporter substrate-binding protein [Bacillus canaveralius]PLR93345.1 molybdate ABC transporter substrate-binding protein [Bacillus canaveralius]RSK56458.1 molybdate ABC transporter substrate-binding protein [Bacillus canaveralius]